MDIRSIIGREAVMHDHRNIVDMRVNTVSTQTTDVLGRREHGYIREGECESTWSSRGGAGGKKHRHWQRWMLSVIWMHCLLDGRTIEDIEGGTLSAALGEKAIEIWVCLGHGAFQGPSNAATVEAISE